MEYEEIDEGSSENYLAGIARVHDRAYSEEHFTSFFSIEKLEQYYDFLIQASDLTVVAVEGNDVVGFIISGRSVAEGVAAFTEINRGYLLWIFLLHPNFIFQKAKSIAVNRLTRPTPLRANFRLLSIAVSSSSQSKGVGADMLGFFERSLVRRGELSYGLSVRGVNDRAVKFYEAMGFILEKESHGARYFFKNLPGSD